MQKNEIIKNCRALLEAYNTGLLGQTVMPEDSNPNFSVTEIEERLAFFTLPMALNYQRNSYTLWEAALKTYRDPETCEVFNISAVNKMPDGQLLQKLKKYKLALQPNKHINTWKRISEIVYKNWGSFEGLLKTSDYDYLKLREIIQIRHKKEFPYLSGPKIFNYWCFILNTYCCANLKNSEYIEIAPDTHITKCSVMLGVISEKESSSMPKDEISERWRNLLQGSGITPIQMHPPLWFWSRNGFLYKIDS